MYETPIVFTAQFADELMVQAAYAFRDYQFKRYGPLFITACIVNALGLWVVLRYGAEADVRLVAIVLLVILGPTWLVYKYFVAPSHLAAKLRRRFPSEMRVSMAFASVSFDVQGEQVEIPWSAVKAVVETSNLFLLVVSPFAFMFLPRISMPVEAQESLHARSRYRAA